VLIPAQFGVHEEYDANAGEDLLYSGDGIIGHGGVVEGSDVVLTGKQNGIVVDAYEFAHESAVYLITFLHPNGKYPKYQ
jgi:hypothetical protein